MYDLWRSKELKPIWEKTDSHRRSNISMSGMPKEATGDYQNGS
jgi:hypothetical protein